MARYNSSRCRKLGFNGTNYKLALRLLMKHLNNFHIPSNYKLAIVRYLVYCYLVFSCTTPTRHCYIHDGWDGYDYAGYAENRFSGLYG